MPTFQREFLTHFPTFGIFLLYFLVIYLYIWIYVDI